VFHLLQEQSKKILSIFALGGAGEIGKNMYGVQYDQDIVIIDAGLKYPEEDMLGIDMVIPDISYLVEHQNMVRGILLTHGHVDHIGGLSYILRHLTVPVYGTEFTLGLVKSQLQEVGLDHSAQLNLITSASKLELGSIQASFFHTQHSIPGSVGICLNTPEGRIIHTGDFKFDYTPVTDETVGLDELSQIGDEGVLVLLSDSANADKPGFSGSERQVGQELGELFYLATGRIIIAAVSTNIQRIQQVINAASVNSRRVALIGKSMRMNVNLAIALDYLQVPEGLILDVKDSTSIPHQQIVFLTSGTQGETMAELSKMARADHHQVGIMEGDTVIIASSPIPGNEKAVSRVVDQLYRLGAEVIYGPRVHVAGDGYQEELKLMLALVRPKYFLPIQGEYRMIKAHAALAEQVGIKARNIFLLDNGESVEFFNGQAKKGTSVQAGQVLIDGLGIGDIGNIVLRDRRVLSQDGILVIIVTVDKQDGAILSGPNIISRGFVYVQESEQFLDEASRLVSGALERCAREKMTEWSSLKTSIRDVLSRFLYEKTKRRPMILPIIMEA
jgi:ribonuclease J